jgi:hypothetical protein
MHGTSARNGFAPAADAGSRGMPEGIGNPAGMATTQSPSADEDAVAAAVAIVDMGSKDVDVARELGETYSAAKSYLTALFKAAEVDGLA